MEKVEKCASALTKELELNAATEAQVAQAESLLEIVNAIRDSRLSASRNLILAAASAAAVSVLSICLFVGFKFNEGQNQLAEYNKLQTQNEWLWKSHHVLISLLEDDPKLLTNSEFRWFTDTATSARVDAFNRMAHDRHHPNLDAWLDENFELKNPTN